jgi:hypothetical protein
LAAARELKNYVRIKQQEYLNLYSASFKKPIIGSGASGHYDWLLSVENNILT